MTITDENRLLIISEAADRIAEIQLLYQSMRKLMQVWLVTCDDPTPDMPKKLLAKLSDIQAANTMLLKAEVRFHDLSKEGGSDDPTADIDAIRADIGSKLDGLRSAIADSGVSVAID